MTLKKNNSILQTLSSPTIFFYSCSWLIILVIAGTLAQRSMGLYMAQQKFFSSWIFWFGPVPLPGGHLTMSIIFLNLLVYILLTAPYKKSMGLFITHLGALLLLVGGFLTAYFSTEGSMIIQEGDTSNFVSDYHRREFTVTIPAEGEDQITAFGEGWLKKGEVLKNPSFQGEIKILESYPNCEVVKREKAASDFKDFGANFNIVNRPSSGSENNMLGVIASLSGFGEDTDGNYIFIEFQDKATRVGKARLLIRKERTYLPFALHLLDFEKKVYPGTQTPKSYKSIVNLLENGQSRRVVIQMNEPLRHKGYTFFQSSFMERPGKDSTVLAVVKNYGRQFPYISSMIMSIGLLIHLISLIPGLKPNAMKHKEKEA
jgi:hypothetical protein